MITINALRFRYAASEFELVIENLSIERGEKVALIGPSGSGKTTLLNLIAGIGVPQSGEVVVDGKCLSKMSDGQRRNFRISQVGFVFQQFELLEYLTATDNILLPFYINSSLTITDQRRQTAIQRAEQMGLAGKLNRHPERLSQGEQQRVAICRALVNEPSIILADEPTGNLDPFNKHKILELLFQLVSQGGQTLIVVTHDLGILEGFDRVIDFNQFATKGESAWSGATEPAKLPEESSGRPIQTASADGVDGEGTR